MIELTENQNIFVYWETVKSSNHRRDGKEKGTKDTDRNVFHPDIKRRAVLD